MKQRGIILLMLMVLAFTCRPDRIRKAETIPEKKLIPLLVDIYLLQGSFYSPVVFRNYGGIDSTALFGNLFEKHGVTRKELDRTLDYYSARPDKLEKIYQKLLVQLTQLETTLQEPETEPGEPVNLWNQKKKWSFAGDGTGSTIPFVIPLKGPGTYTIQVRLRLYDDDQLVNPRLTAYFWHKNETPQGKISNFPVRKYQKSSRVIIYSVSKHLGDEPYTHLRGNILDYDPPEEEGNWNRHVDIEDISVTYTPERMMKFQPG